MVFVFTFAVGGGSGKVIPMPNWALVSFFFLSFTLFGYLIFNLRRILLEIQIIVKDSRNLYLIGSIVYHLIYIFMIYIKAQGFE